MAKHGKTMDHPPTDAEKLLELMALHGYRMAQHDLTVLAKHLALIDGRGKSWTASYMMAVAKGQLAASHRLLDAIIRCSRWPPPKPLWTRNEFRIEARECACGALFIPNSMTRIHCYRCRPIRSRSSPRYTEDSPVR